MAFDGDGDRIGAVDGKGRVIWGGQLLSILAEPVLEKHPGATIITDVKSSEALYDHVGELGGEPCMWKTGHSLIKKKIAETGAPLAGEMSGHIFFADDFYGDDDALYVAVRLIAKDLLKARGCRWNAVQRVSRWFFDVGYVDSEESWFRAEVAMLPRTPTVTEVDRHR